MSNWNKIFKPIVVLCVICIVVTGALAATNRVTAPIFGVSDRTLFPGGINVANVSDVYRTTNDVGVVITSSAKGYGGDVVVMTAITPDGTIKQIKVTEQSETKGIGSNVVSTPSYWERYEGVSAGQALVLNQDIDAYSGATISSKAVLSAVNSAIEAYNQIP